MIQFKANTSQFIEEDQLEKSIAAAPGALAQIKINPMAGWLNLPAHYDKTEFDRIKTASVKINNDSQYLVCIGIGGSYLGHRAIIEALGNTSPTKILYAGNSLSPVQLHRVLEQLGDADFSINIISKSGTTIEPAIAFRIFKQKLVAKYGDEGAAARIYATTDQSTGALHDEAEQQHYERFIVPDNIGGRYSVLTAVGLLPLAVAGVDIDALMQGAADERGLLLAENGGRAARYAAARHQLDAAGYGIEIMANFEPSFAYFNEWWKQLAGESEGKNQTGIFPASVIGTTDLHSMGQYLQEGRRNLFETVVNFTTLPNDYTVPTMPPEDLDGLTYLENKSLAYINQQAIAATISAHLAGGVPVLEITSPDISASSMGALIYFFELSIALSGHLFGIDPFNQPGVEAYKINLFHLLGKPKS